MGNLLVFLYIFVAIPVWFIVWRAAFRDIHGIYPREFDRGLLVPTFLMGLIGGAFWPVTIIGYGVYKAFHAISEDLIKKIFL